MKVQHDSFKGREEVSAGMSSYNSNSMSGTRPLIELVIVLSLIPALTSNNALLKPLCIITMSICIFSSSDLLLVYFRLTTTLCQLLKGALQKGRLNAGNYTLPRFM